MKILIADDDGSARRLLSSALASATMNVVGVADGAEALRACDAHMPAVILLDWLMPGLDGIDVCRQIRQRQGAHHPYIIMVTSRGATDDIVTAFATGADDYVTKPFDLDELRARVWAGVRLALRDEALVHETAMLHNALARLHSLPETVPICASCKRVRDGATWQPVEQFVSDHSGVHFSHGLCTNCLETFA